MKLFHKIRAFFKEDFPMPQPQHYFFYEILLQCTMCWQCNFKKSKVPKSLNDQAYIA